MRAEEENAKITRWHSITTRQALVTFVIALLLSAGTGLFQLVSDARVVRAETREDFERLLNLVEGSAAEAAFQLNPDLANQVVEGLYNYRGVRYVSLRDDFGRVLMEKGNESSEGAGDAPGGIVQWCHPLPEVAELFCLPDPRSTAGW